MKKKILVIVLALMMFMTNGVVLATQGAEIPSEFYKSDDSGITPMMGQYDIYLYFDSHQGEQISHNYTEYRSGDTYYYRGYLRYNGRDTETIIPGLGFGRYRYWGDKRSFTLYKIVKRDGSIITPSSHYVTK